MASFKCSGKPCPECGRELYITNEEEYVERTLVRYRFLECLHCGHSELKNEQRTYKPRASSRQQRDKTQ